MKIHACSHAVMLAQAHTLARYQIHTRMITHVPMRTDTDIWMTSCDDVIVMGPKCIVLFFSLTIFLSFSSFYMNASFGCCSFNCYNFLYHAFIYVHIILFRLEIYFFKMGFPQSQWASRISFVFGVLDICAAVALCDHFTIFTNIVSSSWCVTNSFF